MKKKCPNCELKSHKAVFVNDVRNPYCPVCNKPLLISALQPKQIQKEVRIRQRKGEVYYETSIEKPVSGGWIPFIVEHGITQEEADTKAFRSLLSPYKEMKI